MPFHERTNEFILIIQRYKNKSQFSQNHDLYRNKTVKTYQNSQSTESFKNVVKYITNMIQQTENKLCQLEGLLDLMANSYSGDFMKIDSLTTIILTDINDLTKSFSKMQELLKEVSNKASVNVQKRAHFTSISLNVQSRFQDVSKRFKDCMKMKENLVRLSHARSLPTETDVYDGNRHPINGYQTWNNNNGPMLGNSQMLMTPVDSELRQRDKSVKEVEATIIQLGDMFEQFSSVVQEQEELVRGIEFHANSSFLDIEEAHSQLAKYFKTVQSHRRLILRVFAVLIVCVLIFTYVL